MRVIQSHCGIKRPLYQPVRPRRTSELTAEIREKVKTHFVAILAFLISLK